jgi:hypothetical protein
MFENAQTESSSGSGKIIGGVVVVVAVLLAAVYFLFLRGTGPANGGGAAGSASAKAAATGEKPDPMKDLTILHFNLGRDQATQTMAIWDIQVQNRNHGGYGYKNLKYATNYYNGQDALVYHNVGTLSDTVDPGDQHTYSQINDGLYPVGTTRYTIELTGADPVQE